jgi:hypothetical protein
MVSGTEEDSSGYGVRYRQKTNRGGCAREEDKVPISKFCL